MVSVERGGESRGCLSSEFSASFAIVSALKSSISKEYVGPGCGKVRTVTEREAWNWGRERKGELGCLTKSATLGGLLGSTVPKYWVGPLGIRHLKAYEDEMV